MICTDFRIYLKCLPFYGDSANIIFKLTVKNLRHLMQYQKTENSVFNKPTNILGNDNSQN